MPAISTFGLVKTSEDDHQHECSSVTLQDSIEHEDIKILGDVVTDKSREPLTPLYELDPDTANLHQYSSCYTYDS
jgi:hypothetical protein